MTFFEIYNKNFLEKTDCKLDFYLVKTSDFVFIGVDNSGFLVVMVKSGTPNKQSIIKRTKQLSVECNVDVTGEVEGIVFSENVHILRCFSFIEKEKKIFLELAEILLQENICSDDSILETFQTLYDFFSDKHELSDIELIGFFAEFYTIKKFHEVLSIEKYWQSKDRMKFDFSFSEKLKLEVKSTIKQLRQHHFKHEQLITDLFDIYVLSYKFRHDDEGLSLFALMEEIKPLFSFDRKKLLRFVYIEKNTSEERIKALKFNEIHLLQNMKFYKAADIPKFNQLTPTGVANAEYDCSLENISPIDEIEMINLFKEQIKNNNE